MWFGAKFGRAARDKRKGRNRIVACVYTRFIQRHKTLLAYATLSRLASG